jgi:hypothetical protein
MIHRRNCDRSSSSLLTLDKPSIKKLLDWSNHITMRATNRPAARGQKMRSNYFALCVLLLGLAWTAAPTLGDDSLARQNELIRRRQEFDRCYEPFMKTRAEFQAVLDESQLPCAPERWAELEKSSKKLKGQLLAQQKEVNAAAEKLWELDPAYKPANEWMVCLKNHYFTSGNYQFTLRVCKALLSHPDHLDAENKKEALYMAIVSSYQLGDVKRSASYMDEYRAFGPLQEGMKKLNGIIEAALSAPDQPPPKLDIKH